MFIDQFWKILFIALLATGGFFWLQSNKKKKIYQLEVAELAEYIDVRPERAPKTDEEAAKRSFQAINLLIQMANKRGEKFEVRDPLLGAAKINEASEGLADLLADTFETSFKNAMGFGFLADEDALWALEQGNAPTIAEGIWAGQTAGMGYHIPPGVNESLAKHLANRVLLPANVKAAMIAGDVTREVDNWAERLKKVEVLDLSEREQIKRDYSALHELTKKN